jgi:hypothetical protein
MFTARAAPARTCSIAWGLCQRVGGAREDRVDGARRDPRAEQLLAQLDDVAAADAVAHRQRHHGGLQPRPECARCNRLGQSRRLALAAAGADDALALMLGHAHGHHRQLFDLTARRLTDSDPIGRPEHVPARAASRPVLHRPAVPESTEKQKPMRRRGTLRSRMAEERMGADPLEAGWAALSQGNWGRARAYFEEALAARETPEEGWNVRDAAGPRGRALASALSLARRLMTRIDPRARSLGRSVPTPRARASPPALRA